MFYFIDSISFKKIIESLKNSKKLENLEMKLDFSTIDLSLKEAFQNISSLKRLKIFDGSEIEEVASFYATGISQLIHLKELRLQC